MWSIASTEVRGQSSSNICIQLIILGVLYQKNFPKYLA